MSPDFFSNGLSMAITKEQLFAQLRKVNDPQLHRDIVTLNQVRQLAYCDGVVSVGLELTSMPDQAVQQRTREQIDAVLRKLGDEIRQVNVTFSRKVSLQQPQPAEQAAAPQAGPQDEARANNPLPGVKHIIAVGAGKGGVGKSTVAVNLAVGLARLGAKVGLLDGDIYGPSMPTMLGLDQLEPKVQGNMILPFEVHGIKAMTIGALVEQDKPLIWRGPMAHGAFRQLVTQTLWGELDHLIIDLPPGTGDVPLTMSQLLPLTGAVVVCTPQKVAQDDARRAVRMFQQLGVAVLGLIENMSYFLGDDGKEYDIFGRGGAQSMAQSMGLPFLGMVPIHTRLCANSDRGNPTGNFAEDDKLSQELTRIADRLLGQVNVAALDQQQQTPTINIS